MGMWNNDGWPLDTSWQDLCGDYQKDNEIDQLQRDNYALEDRIKKLEKEIAQLKTMIKEKK